MRIPRSFQYVNNMRNIGYLTGFARRLDKIKGDTWHKTVLPPDWHGVLIQQTNNVMHALPVQVPMGVPLPGDREPVTVAVHVFGHIDPVLNEPTLSIESLDMARPSVRAMPSSLIWTVAGDERFAEDDFNPFGKDGNLLREIREKLDSDYTEMEAVLQTMLLANKGRLDTRWGGNSNVMVVAGFLEARIAVVPTKDDYQNNPYWSILLRQHKDRRACLPIRLYTQHMRSFRDKLRRAGPYLAIGQLRVKVVQNEDGSVKGGLVYLRTDDIHGADRVRDILEVPDWYTELRLEIMREIEERQKSLDRAASSVENALFGAPA